MECGKIERKLIIGESVDEMNSFHGCVGLESRRGMTACPGVVLVPSDTG